MQKMIYLAETDSERDCPLQGVCTLRPSDPERENEIGSAEIIFGNPTVDELHRAKALKWVQMTWAGADRYLSGDFPRNVHLTTASGAFGETIAEHTLAMLFALCRRLPAYIRAGAWCDLGCEKQVCGATAMIFGCGDLGGSLARRLKALGVTTVGVCRNARQRREGFDVLTTLECAELFLPEADFVLCALPHSAQTAGYFDSLRIGLLKQDAIFINVGRGSLADIGALAQALSEGRLFGVGLDVTDPEPLPQEHPLWTQPNAIITPHVAGVSFGHLPQTEQKIWAICEENLVRYRRGEALKNEVKLP
ncbi:MAG: D-2-hydroxyacid dehydrogenase [Faecousia sp.]